MNKKGRLASGDVVVCTLTGHGLKDIEVAMSVSQKPVTVEATFDDVVKVLGY